MSYVLPIFITGEDIQEEFIKGVELRFKMANLTETNKITPVIVEPRTLENTVINHWKEQGCYIGISMHSSKVIPNAIDDFVLIAPLASAAKVKNVVPLILSEWEADTITKILEKNNSKVKKEGNEEIAIISDLETDDPYLATYNKISNITKGSFCELSEDIRACVVIGKNKWNLMKELPIPNKNYFVITTCSFEDWQMAPILRKKLVGLHYTYPKLSDNAQKVVEVFEKEFKYKPSIYNLLAYDGVSIAIKTLLEVSLPTYKNIKKHLFHNVFDLKVTGKSAFPFDENSIKSLLIGQSPEELFKTKYIDEKGNYENLTKIGENNASIAS